MRKAINAFVVVFLLVVALAPFKIETVRAGAITVPDDYLTIQEAIDNANIGDTVFVKNGTYYERPIVNKAISLVGENKFTTIIDGGGYRSVVQIIAKNVGMSGFTIRNGEYDSSFCGIYINSSDNHVSQNIIAQNFYGIRLWFSSGNNLSENDIENNCYAIRLDSSSSNNIIGNRIRRNYDYGVFVQSSSLNTICENELTNNRRSLMLYDSSYCSISGNLITENLDYGIWLSFANRNSIYRNSIAANDGGGADNGNGIWLFEGSLYNRIFTNNITNNCYGIRLRDWSDLNNITENLIEANVWGLNVDWAAGNTICHNNIAANTQQAYSNGDVRNDWDNDIEGNYWSGYTGTDSDGDGVGDAPYVIDGSNQDNCPLMSPYMPGDINHDAIVDIFDCAKMALAFSSTPASSNWNPHCDVNEDGLIDIFDLVAVAVNFGKEWTPP